MSTSRDVDLVQRSAKKARRTLLGCFALAALLMGILTSGVFGSNAQWTPRLGLDLAGGSEVILAPVLNSGQSASSEQVVQAQNIIRQRVDARGVSGAEVTTRGKDNIVVSVPGIIDQRTEQALQASSQMQFRAVLMQGPGSTAPAAAKPSPAVKGPATNPSKQTDKSRSPGASRTRTRTPAAPLAKAQTPAAPVGPTNPAWATAEVIRQFTKLDCKRPQPQKSADDPKAALVTCSADRVTKYILGPVAISGQDIKSASAGYQSNQQGVITQQVAIDLSFDSDATDAYGKLSTEMVKLPDPSTLGNMTKPQAVNSLATVLDGRVLIAPRFTSAITNGNAQITGGFTIEEARDLAQQLRFGALPMSFQMENNQKISPTLGTEQLRLGLLAGLIGLLLVVGYSVLQYRALAMVTIGSMLVAGLLTYLAIAILGWRYNYRLDMAGVTGLIVAIGVTADSFIVYFERVRDELREGRTLRAAIEAGWARAKRTILIADGVNFLAALVLYLLASSNVRGFAFSLGLTTLIDLLIVWIFTHPVLVLLAGRRFFAHGHRFSGLDPDQLANAGTRYVGRGRIATPQAGAR